MDSFSKRFNYGPPIQAEITVREDAPEVLRACVLQLSYQVGLSPNDLREAICRTLLKMPDRNNWSEPNIKEENESLLMSCQWYMVYEIIEVLAHYLTARNYSQYERFVSRLNDFFGESGIGWKLVDTGLEVRGSEAFEVALNTAKTSQQQSGHQTASNELHKAIYDLSRRPTPDITGAIQHGMASLECVARQITGDHRSTLGQILNHHRGLLPPPLDTAVGQVWGFASNNGRHLLEGKEPAFEEAELVVGLCASVSNYLIKKINAKN